MSDNKIEVTLDAIAQDTNGKLILTTSEGAVWQQVENVPVRPTPKHGGTMAVEKTSFGGFMCTTSKWASFRCFRSR